MKEPVEAGRPLAEAIAAETARRDLTQDEASKILGTTQQTMGKWINGRTRPGDTFVPALAKYLGMTEDKVRELRGPMRTDPRDRMLLRRRVDQLERRLADQASSSEKLIARLETLASRLDDFAERLDAVEFPAR